MASVQDAQHVFSGMYGTAWRDGAPLFEVVEFNGAVEVNRIEVPLVGQTKQGYKPGRESREGTMRLYLVHSRWEKEFHDFTENRAANITLRTFDLKLTVADPGAYQIGPGQPGRISWMLHGVQIWRMPLGFSITDDLIDRELPVTWESEEPLEWFGVDDQGKVTPFSTGV